MDLTVRLFKDLLDAENNHNLEHLVEANIQDPAQCVFGLGFLAKDMFSHSIPCELRLVSSLLGKKNPSLLVNDGLASVIHSFITSLSWPSWTWKCSALRNWHRTSLQRNTVHSKPIYPIFYSIHWLSLVYQVKFEVLVVAFKAVHGLDPGQLKGLLKIQVEDYGPLVPMGFP